MSTRFMLAALPFFAVSAFVGVALMVFAPMGGMRNLGYMVTACGALGFIIQLYALHSFDPHAFMVLRYRVKEFFARIGASIHPTAHAASVPHSVQ